MADNMAWQNIGLSCVENYLLYLFNKNKIPINCVFYQSGVSPSDILQHIINGERYATFSGVDRLQCVAQKMGMSDYQFIRLPMISKDSIRMGETNTLVCVTPTYVREKYGDSLWRDDHYILLTTQTAPSQFTYLNDFPYDQGTISLDELGHVYQGSLIYVRMLNGGSDITKAQCLHQYLQFSARKTNEFYLPEDVWADSNMIRDLLLVWKTLRYRLKLFYMSYCSKEDYDDPVPEINVLLKDLEHQLFLFEYWKAKNKLPIGSVAETIQKLQLRDTEINKKVYHNLSKIWSNIYE